MAHGPLLTTSQIISRLTDLEIIGGLSLVIFVPTMQGSCLSIGKHA